MKSLAVILLGLCLAQLRHVNAEVKVLQKTIVGHDKMLVYPYHTYYNEHLSYALCDNNPEADKVKCNVVREKTPYGNDTYSCDVTLNRREYHYMPVITIFSFENYIAINVFEAHHVETYMNFTTVQWKSCQVGEAIIDTKIQLSIPYADFTVVGHNDSYDVILYDNSHMSYVNKSKKITIGTDGHVIDGPSPSIVSLTHADIIHSYFAPINGGSLGYFQIQMDDDEDDDNEYVHVLIKPDGTQKILATSTKPQSPVFLSTKNNLLNACYQTISAYNCTQYDYDGNLKLQTTIPHNFTLDGTILLNIYNLPNGGFYLLSAQCPNGRRDCNRIDRQFSIDRINANGTRTGSLKFQGLELVTDYQESISWLFYEDEAERTCLSVLLPNAYDGKNQLNLIANCFTDADFSV